jgi:hypothetical protein
MKTKTTKSVKKPEKVIVAKVEQVAKGNTEPSEAEIRELAEIIFKQRIKRGEPGTAEDDWLEAEKRLRN